MSKIADKSTEPREEWPAGIAVEGEVARVDLPETTLRLPLMSLPEDKIEWIEGGRRATYSQLLNGKGGPIKFAAHHLPMITTYSSGCTFPFNCCNKGVGFLPKKQHIGEFVDFFRNIHERTRGIPWRESLAQRVEAARRFYFDREKIDYRVFATLEIFEKTTLSNLRRTPLASLLFTGDSPVFTSFQVNAAVEIIGQDDPRHTFIMLLRTLFEADPFHIYQPQFPYAYLFWISEVKDKTPVRMEAQPGKVQYERAEGGLRWETEALDAIGRAPSLIQKHIRELIETYARQRGYLVITGEFVQEAKEQFMPS